MDDYWNVSRTTTPTARKQHLCNACYAYIEAGEQYRRTDGIFDGEGATFKQCEICKPDEDREHHRPSQRGEVMAGFRDVWSDERVCWYSADGEQWTDELEPSQFIYFSTSSPSCFERQVAEAAEAEVERLLERDAEIVDRYPDDPIFENLAEIHAGNAARAKQIELTKAVGFVVASVTNEDKQRGERSTVELAIPTDLIAVAARVRLDDGEPSTELKWIMIDSNDTNAAERLEY